MSLPDQEARALDAAFAFLMDLAGGKEKRIPQTTRQRAREVARHFPLAAGTRWLGTVEPDNPAPPGDPMPKTPTPNDADDDADDGARTTVHYEVWRSHVRGPDLCIYRNMDEVQGTETLQLCLQDKAEGYPDSPIDFYLVRATTTRTRVTSPEPAKTDG